jgi:hypothetical protein
VQERASKDRQYVDSQHNAGHSNVGNRKWDWCNCSSKFSPAAHPQGNRCCINRADQPQRSVAIASQWNHECKNFSSASLAESSDIKKGLTYEKERIERMTECIALGNGRYPTEWVPLQLTRLTRLTRLTTRFACSAFIKSSKESTKSSAAAFPQSVLLGVRRRKSLRQLLTLRPVRLQTLSGGLRPDQRQGHLKPRPTISYKPILQFLVVMEENIKISGAKLLYAANLTNVHRVQNDGSQIAMFCMFHLYQERHKK